MLNTQQIKDAREKVERRRRLYSESVREYEETVDRLIDQANTELISQPLKIVDMARLLEVNPSTVYRMEANHCDSYADLRRWIAEHRPEKLPKLEENYKQFIRDRKQEG